MLVCSHDELESPHTLKTDTIARSDDEDNNSEAN